MNIQKTSTAPTAPGIYSGLSNAAYHAGPGISKSGLDYLAKSPLHYWDAYLKPMRMPREETPAMAFGTAVHAAILEPDEYAKWIVWEKQSRATKEGKASWAEAQARAEAAGSRVISNEDDAVVSMMASMVHKHRYLGPYLENGVPELSVYWNDPDTGVFCRCRPDWLAVDAVIDVKTTTDASPRAFQRSALNYRYWVQAAFYLDGLAANDVNVCDFVFAAVEKTSPYAVVAYPAAKEMIEAGRAEYKRLLKLLAACERDNSWPGYADVMELQLPYYGSVNLAADDAFAADNESV